MLIHNGENSAFIMSNGADLALFVDGMVIHLPDSLLTTISQSTEMQAIECTSIGDSRSQFIQGPLSATVDLSFRATGPIQVYPDMTKEELYELLGFTGQMTVRQLLAVVSKKMSSRKF